MSEILKKVKKRDGRLVDFDPTKVGIVIWKAVQAVGGKDQETSNILAQSVVKRVEEVYGETKIPSVEDIQDLIEKVLIEEGHSTTAKAFILYRKKRQEIREAKLALGVNDDMKLSFEALRLLAVANILQKKNDGSLETPREMFIRVAKAVSKIDRKYDEDSDKFENELLETMLNLDLLPSIKILQAAGTNNQQLSDAISLPVEDDIVGLFDTLKRAAFLHKNRQRGFGLSFSFSEIRSKGRKVGTSGAVAAGPVTYLQLYNDALSQINPYGTNMAFLSVHHPDIIDFITAKENSQLTNFGTTVVFSKKFMKAVQDDTAFELIDPHTQKKVASLRAKSVLDIIATIAWRTGDPAILFEENMNKPPANPFEGHRIKVTSPTGEQPMLEYEACFSASINLAKHIKDKQIDFDKLKKSINTGVHLLDNSIDLCNYPSSYVKNTMEGTRRIALGVMGFADLLIRMEIPYNSDKAIKTGEEIIKFLSDEAREASKKLAAKRGTFKWFDKSIYAKKNLKYRNCACTTILHSGYSSVIAGCSQGIEPYYAVSYLKKTQMSENVEVIPIFEEIANKEGFYSQELMKKVALAGSVADIKEIPKLWREVFVTTHDCQLNDHVAMQKTFQKYTDNGVSKTLNLPTTATISEIEEIFINAYDLGLRSVHIYREGSNIQQLIYSKEKRKKRR